MSSPVHSSGTPSTRKLTSTCTNPNKVQQAKMVALLRYAAAEARQPVEVYYTCGTGGGGGSASPMTQSHTCLLPVKLPGSDGETPVMHLIRGIGSKKKLAS